MGTLFETKTSEIHNSSDHLHVFPWIAHDYTGKYKLMSCSLPDFTNSKSDTVKSRVVDRSTIQFLTIFGLLLTKTCYYLRRATIAMSSNQSTNEYQNVGSSRILIRFFSIFINMKMHLHSISFQKWSKSW